MEIYRDPSRSPKERVVDLLSRMTLKEKIAQLCAVWGYELMERRETFSREKAALHLRNGIGQITRHGNGTTLPPREVAEFANQVQHFLREETRLGIPALMHEECLCGYQARGATIFPQAIGLASTWNPALIKEMTTAIRRQLTAVGARQALAPVLDVAREPRWGRVEETYGEDAYLTASIGKAYIEGLQGERFEEGVAATTKHFAGYGNPEAGLNWAPGRIPPREYREVYLFPFEAAVREAGVMSVMNAYCEIDGIACGSWKELLSGILRKEWGFEGFVVSDYESINELHAYHHVCADAPDAARAALEAGIDVELPEIRCFKHLEELVESSRLSPGTLDAAVKRILLTKFKLGLFENPWAKPEIAAEVFDTPADRELARNVASQSIVLLKNESNLLPLGEGVKKLAVIGPNADSWRNLLGDYSYASILEMRKIKHEGMASELMIDSEFDIKTINVPVVTVLDGIRKLAPAGTEVIYAPGCEVLSDNREGFIVAIEAAEKADVAIVVVGDKSGFSPGCTSGEERDSMTLQLPGVQRDLVRAVASTGTPMVLVLVCGRPYAVEWEAEHSTTVLAAWLPGEEGGAAIAEVLFCKTPGGKLPITFPRHVGQVPNYYSHKPSARKSHLWGDYIDGSVTPLFPFGHGLSFTTFEYRDLSIEPDATPSEGVIVIGFDLVNVGEVPGDEVVQLYLRDTVASVTRPVKELKGFARVTLEPRERKRISFELSADQLAFYDREMRLVVEPGEFEVMIGASSADIRLEGRFRVTGEKRFLSGRRRYFSRVSIE
jgi:beta-glucosidase